MIDRAAYMAPPPGAQPQQQAQGFQTPGPVTVEHIKSWAAMGAVAWAGGKAAQWLWAQLDKPKRRNSSGRKRVRSKPEPADPETEEPSEEDDPGEDDEEE